VFDDVDLYHSGDEEVIAIGWRDPLTAAETLMQKAAAVQARYNFRFDVTKLVVERRIDFPKVLKGELLTDDFAPVNVFDSYGRLYRIKGH